MIKTKRQLYIFVKEGLKNNTSYEAKNDDGGVILTDLPRRNSFLLSEGIVLIN